MTPQPKSNKTSVQYLSYTEHIANGKILWPIFIASVLTGATIALLSLTPLQHTAVKTWVLDRGLIPYIITFLFWTALCILAFKYRFKIAHERQAIDLVQEDLFNRGEKESGVASHIDSKTAAILLDKISSFNKKDRRTMVVNRIEKCLHRLMNTRSTTEMDSIMKSLSEVDHDIVDSSYISIRFLSAVIPILGFLGTVFGIGEAIGGFANVIVEAGSFEAIKPHLKDVSYNLGIAFQTTLLALICSGIILLISSFVQKREEDVLSSVDGYCIDNILAKIRMPSDVSDAADKIVYAIEGQTTTFESMIKNITEEMSNTSGLLKEVNSTLTKECEGISEKMDRVSRAVDSLEQTVSSPESEVAQRFQDVQEKLGELLELEADASESLKDVSTILTKECQRIFEKVEEVSRSSNAIWQAVGSGESELVQDLRVIQDKLGRLCELQVEPMQAIKNLINQKNVKDLFKRVDDFGKRLDALKPVGDSFEELVKLDEMFGEIQTTLQAIKPAIENMSSEMAKEVNEILKRLLKVNVVIHKLDRMDKGEIERFKEVNVDDLPF